MSKRTIFYCFVIACITLSAIVAGIFSGSFRHATVLDIPPSHHVKTLVLLPLDSRPACTQFVEQLALLANIRVLLPPEQYMDNYTQPADREALAKWLRESAKHADAAIVSTDMLLAGSLLASRTTIPSFEDIGAAADLLTEIRKENPTIRLYAFHIIPRLLIADHTPDKQHQKAMQTYSILQDQILLFENPLDMKKITELEKTIPKRVIDQYRMLYARNEAVHRMWISLTKSNILDALVIGQDDGYHFGMPNMVKQRLAVEVANDALEDKVIITRGTDEVALTLLGHLAMSEKAQAKVYVEYSSIDAPQVVMPFMPHSVATTVSEKLRLIRARQVFTSEEADFILFIHIGRRNSSPISLTYAAQRLKQHVASDKPVALVDLTEDYYAWQTLLPYAIREDAGVHRLAAYAGWNTTSNSIGTAITQAALYTAANQSGSPSNRLRLEYDNLTFLVSRLLDDWHYLKEVQPQVNQGLRAIEADPYRLQNRRSKTELLIRRRMAEREDTLMQKVFLNKPIHLAGFAQPILVEKIESTISLPWDRTFEIKVQPQISLIQLEDK